MRLAVGYYEQPAVFHYFSKLIVSPTVNSLTLYILCFVSFSRSRGQTVGRRWVWRVIPLHLSINLETISSVPYRMSKPRWAEDESIIFFLRLSLEFLPKHINTSCVIILYCPPSLSVNGGLWQWVNAVEWVVFYAVCKRKALFENNRIWQDPFFVPDITLYGLWWGMCQWSPV